MTITFYNTTGADNVINKSLNDGVTYNCNLNIDTTQINSTARVDLDPSTAPDSISYNYAVITLDSGMSYYYFVDSDNIRQQGKGLFLIPLRLDVLMQYKDSILNSAAIIERSSSSYNMYLQDNMYKSYQYPRIGCRVFPRGFNSTYNYLLAVNSQGGV